MPVIPADYTELDASDDPGSIVDPAWTSEAGAEPPREDPVLLALDGISVWLVD